MGRLVPDPQRAGPAERGGPAGTGGGQEIGLTFAADSPPPRHDREARLALLESTFADVGWRAEEFLAAARQAEDFALDTFDQVHMPSWRDGRVVLLGDSAWSASPISGLGTALALRGRTRRSTGDGRSPGPVPASLTVGVRCHSPPEPPPARPSP